MFPLLLKSLRFKDRLVTKSSRDVDKHKQSLRVKELATIC